jgi:diguanylate cyclase (GGDEF)-like protein/PAS domain S-box-containing protein
MPEVLRVCARPRRGLLGSLRAARRARREAQELFEAAFADAPIGMALTALDGRWLRVNQALCKITGYTERGLLERTFRDITHPDDLASSINSLRRLLDGTIPHHTADKRVLSPSGDVIWVNVSVSLVRDAHGHPHHFVAQVQDISQRKRDEHALREERLALDEAQRIARVGSWSWDMRSGTTSWSAELCRIFERNPDDGPATFEELLVKVHPQDRARVHEEYAKTLRGGATVEIDYRILCRDGSTRMLRGIGREDGDRPGTYVGTVQDVTDLRRAELEARRERDYVAAIMSSMRDGFMLTRHGRILQVNQALCEMTGFAREELVGVRTPYPFWPPEEIDEIESHRALIREGRACEFEVTYRRKDGSRFPVSINVMSAQSHDGRTLGYVSTVRDISERKRQEEELNRLATQDPLTGLANHRVFHEGLRAEVARAGRQGLRLSVAVLDLDHFKQINDRYGHLVGDQVLREAGERLRAVVREGEVIARVGGEEFAWILTGLDDDGALAAVERARQVIGETPFAVAGIVTMSAGVAASEPADAADDVYSRADQALYRAKQTGRNRTVRHGAAEPDGLTLTAA